MKTGLAQASLLATVLAFVPDAGAVETRADVETDHVDAQDGAGPRTAGVLVNPLAIALGRFGAEADFALGETAALSLEGDWFSPHPTTAWGASVGVPLFPKRGAFRGLYVHPRVAWVRATSGDAAVHAFAVGAVVGYEWTWPVGATVRLGGGGAYWRRLAGRQPAPPAFVGLQPQVDALLGWIF